MDEKFVCQLKEELKQIDVELTERQIEQFYNYYELLIHWNSMINLTAITQLDEVVTKHFVDSLSLKKIIVDIGQKKPESDRCRHRGWISWNSIKNSVSGIENNTIRFFE